MSCPCLRFLLARGCGPQTSSVIPYLFAYPSRQPFTHGDHHMQRMSVNCGSAWPSLFAEFESFRANGVLVLRVKSMSAVARAGLLRESTLCQSIIGGTLKLLSIDVSAPES